MKISESKYGYLFRIDNELKMIESENIANAIEKVELNYPNSRWTLEFAVSIPILR